MISTEEFIEWKEHPVTKEIFSDLKNIQQNLISQLVNGVTIGQTADETHGNTCKLVGKLDGINQLLGISFEAPDADQEDVEGKSRY